MKTTTLLLSLGLSLSALAAAGGGYANDLQKLPPGDVPEELFVLSGKFTIAEDGGGNRFVELAGAPLDTMGLLFGPEGHAALDVSARVSGASFGRLFPEFGIGMGDAGGHKLYLLPGQRKLVLRRGDDPTPKATAEYAQWKSGDWTHLRLRVAPAGEGKWKVEGKAWPAGSPEPEAWQVTAEDAKAPDKGRASLWGAPFSDLPIRYDDLKATPVGDGK